MRGPLAQQVDNLRERLAERQRRRALAARTYRWPPNSAMAGGMSANRQHQIDGAGRDGAARHPVILGLVRVLGDDQSARRLDGLRPDRAIGGGSRENDADGVFADLIGQRLQEEVEWQSHGGAAGGRGKANCAFTHREIAAGRNDIDVVRFEPSGVLRFDDRHRRMRRQQLDHHALVGRVEVLDQDERHAALGGQRCEQGAEGFEPAGGGADRDHREHGVALRDRPLPRDASALAPLGLIWRWRTACHLGSVPKRSVERD